MKRQYHKPTHDIFLVFALIFLLMQVMPAAEVRAAEEEKGTITYEYAVGGASFTIYKVGNVTEDGYELDEPYASYGVNTNSRAMAQTLAAYVEKALKSETGDACPTAYAEAKTGEDGKAEFTDIERGVYLVIGETVTTDEGTYVPSPVLVSMPTTQDGAVNWNVDIVDKYEFVPGGEESENITVQKIWKNDSEETRPKEIVVQLTCDGKVAEEVTLSKEENNWSYTWKDLEAGHQWTVVEKEVPEGYVVSSDTEDNTVVLTNTGSTPSESETPSEPETSGNPGTNGGSKGSTGKLPKTGQPWIYVLGLTAGGLFLILLGLLTRKRD